MKSTNKKKAARKKTAKRETVLVLRTCKADGSSQHGFLWPESGSVECPDWKPTAKCGNGLHGLLWGEGNGQLIDWSPTARWLVVEVDAASIVDLDDKVKFPRGTVVHCGTRETATQYLAEHGLPGKAITGGTATAGDSGIATAGDSGIATAGVLGTATAGYAGTATAGDRGIATAGDRGTARAGNCGTARAGYGGTATAGDLGCLVLLWWNSTAERCQLSCAIVGENGIKPNTKYRLDGDGKFVEVTSV